MTPEAYDLATKQVAVQERMAAVLEKTAEAYVRIAAALEVIAESYKPTLYYGPRGTEFKGGVE